VREQAIERYSHVMHIVSDVEGELAEGQTSVDALIRCFPAGTVSGAPKIRAMEIIDELEPVKRGPYAGAVGYFDFSGNMDTCIAIRTMLVTNSKVFIQAGAGIVADSDPQKEYLETKNKAGALVEALSVALSITN
jgi:anthranilate synthase component 1